MNGPTFIFTVLIDGLVLIAARSLCRWAMPERFTVRRLLTVTAMIAADLQNFAVWVVTTPVAMRKSFGGDVTIDCWEMHD